MDIYNSKMAKLMAPRGEKLWAVTLGQRTFYSVPKSLVTAAWRRHEDMHKVQWHRDGVAKFMWAYAADYLRGRMDGLGHRQAYLAIRYEVEARRAEKRQGVARG